MGMNASSLDCIGPQVSKVSSSILRTSQTSIIQPLYAMNDPIDLTNLHVISFFATILLGLFKGEVTHILASIALFFSRHTRVGDKIQIQGSDGIWNDLEIVGISVYIPIIKTNGGVHIRQSSGASIYTETLSLDAWKEIRKRRLSA